MDHLPKLIEDLALILLVGAIVTLLFKKIKQPVVLGYIIAGFMVGPHLSIVPTVADTQNVKTLAEIGIIFLLFSLGLEFNIKKVMHIGVPSSVTALVEIIVITVSGYILGQLLGWSTMDSIFLGGMLASSSTTIIIKAFDDLGVRSRQYARIVFGVLIVEDIVVIMLLVLLPAISVAQQIQGMELLLTFLKLFAFLILMFVIGIFVLPPLFRKAKKLFNDETLLIFSVGLCLGMVVLSTKFGLSAELGAFIMGFILAESTSAEKIEHVIKPVKDLFASVFFVSIGMMIDPALMKANVWPILAVTGLTIFGKLFSTTAGAILSGQPLKQSVQVGMSMAQIGEFAFIVVTLGLSLGVISEFLFPVAVGASVITTFTTPYMIQFSDKFYTQLEKCLPPRWLAALKNYSTSTREIQTEKSWRKVLRQYLLIVITNGIVAVTLIFLSVNFLLPLLAHFFKNAILSGIADLFITIVLISPFLWALMAKRLHDKAYRSLWVDQRYNHGPLLVAEGIRVLIGVLIIGFLVDKIFSAMVALFVLVPIIIIIILFFSKQINKFYHRLEKHFLGNLNMNESETSQSSEKIETATTKFNLSPWDAYIVEMEVTTNAGFVGKTLQELGWREKFGINVAFIKRGDELIYAPTKNSILYPFDKIGIIATDDQLQMVNSIFAAEDTNDSIGISISDIVVQNLNVKEHSWLEGLTINNSQIREKIHGLVIGIERKNEQLLNPESSIVFEKGDIIWVVGDRQKIQQLRKEN
jgi:CPA2 family monovalent cation:H+ antiporter-2